MLDTYLRLVLETAKVIEVRAMKDGRPYQAGYFNDPKALIKAIKGLELVKASAIYTTLNELPADIVHRTDNRLTKPQRDFQTKDKEIIRRVWLPFDFDPQRVKGISSTDNELGYSLEMQAIIRAYFQQKGWPEPVSGMSGNGHHLMYRINLDNNDETTTLLKRLYYGLKDLFSGDDVHFDTSVFNAARIWKVYGTTARKGSSSEERPHRLAECTFPADLQIVSAKQIQDAAADFPSVEKTKKKLHTAGHRKNHLSAGNEVEATRGDYTSLDVVMWMKFHKLYQFEMGETKTGMHAIVCPWKAEHSSDSPTATVVFEPRDGGWPGFNCKHDHCQDRTIRDLMDKLGDADTFCADKWSPPVHDWVEELNEIHFVARDVGKTYVFTEEFDYSLGRAYLSRGTVTDFRAFYMNKYVTTERSDGPIAMGTAWLNDPNRREYRGIHLHPNGDVPGYYNLWKGYTVQPKEGNWELFKNHIEWNLCGGSEVYYSYLMKWLARMFQKPGQQGEVAVVLRGKRGTGKGIFARCVGDLFGRHYVHLLLGKHLTGHFNQHLRDCIFLFADEAFWAGDKVGESVLKGLVTEPTFIVEGKGKDAQVIKNMLHLLLSSNEDWVVPASAEERRYFVLDVSEEHMQDKVYFGAILDQMEAGGLEAMLYELMNMDLSDFDVRSQPQTEALMEQKKMSMDSMELWWFQKLKDGILHPEADGDGWGEVMRRHLYEDYARSAGIAGKHYRGTTTALGMKLKQIIPWELASTKRRRVITNKVGSDGISRSITTQEVFFNPPPLIESRRYFEQYFRMGEYDWMSGDW